MQVLIALYKPKCLHVDRNIPIVPPHILGAVTITIHTKVYCVVLVGVALGIGAIGNPKPIQIGGVSTTGMPPFCKIFLFVTQNGA